MRKYRFDVFAAVWVPYALLVHRFWFVTDDAFISFRYARNLVLGHGLRFNPGEHLPVEGYSNFLWVLICAVFEFFRMDVALWPPLVSAASARLRRLSDWRSLSIDFRMPLSMRAMSRRWRYPSV